MNGQTVVDYDKIPEGTRAWLEEWCATWLESPYVCVVPYRDETDGGNIQFMPYKYDTLVNVPLEELKQRAANRLPCRRAA